MSNEAAYDLLAAKLEEAKRWHLAQLNRELFSSPEMVQAAFPLTKRQRFALWIVARTLRVRGYLSTLWMALRGAELVEPHED